MRFESAVIVFVSLSHFKHRAHRLEDSIKLALDPANYLIEPGTAKDDVLRTWEFMTLHPFQG
jgi:hypothetical protein